MFRRHRHEKTMRQMVALIDVLEEQLSLDEIALQRAASEVRYVTNLIELLTED